MTFLNKVRALTLGTAHDLLDKAIDENSPTVLRQYVRDLEEAISKMQGEAAVQAAQVVTLQRQQGDAKSDIASLNSKAEALMRSAAPGHEELAKAALAKVVSLQKTASDLTEQIVNQQKASNDLDMTVAALLGKHDTSVARLRDLERLDRDTKAKESAASALSQAGTLVNGGNVNVDDIESKMRARNDIAGEKFRRSMGDIHADSDPETEEAVNDLFNKLKEKTSVKVDDKQPVGA